MKLNRFLLATAAFALCAAVTAQDFDDFGDFGDFGGGSDSGFGAVVSKISVGGSVSTDVRAYVDVDDIEDVDVDAIPAGKLELSYDGNKSDVLLGIKLDEATIKEHPEDVIDELILRGYFGNFTLEAGKMKVVWGKGDKLHVIDNFNADDYTDFIIPDYIDRRISTPMLRGVFSVPVANLQFEAIYTPFLPVDRFATTDRWTPAQVTNMTGTIKTGATETLALYVKNLEDARLEAATATALQTLGTTEAQTKLEALVTAAYTAGKISYTTEEVVAYCVANSLNPADTANQATAVKAILAEKYEDYLETNLTNANTAYITALNAASALNSDSSIIYPNTYKLKYGQFGGRVTASAAGIDFGVSYYNGYYKQPSFNADRFATWMSGYLSGTDASDLTPFLDYDKKQTFGLEASTVIWHFNVRGEAAYNLTNDTAGNDPWVHNNSVSWLGGFDIDLPFWNANLNVQEYGTFILHGDDIDKNKLDVDYNVNGYTNNKLVCNLTTSFLNDKLAPEVTVMYGFENGDLVVMPKLAFKPDQSLTLTASGMYILCANSDSEFYAWRNNSFVNIGATYQF